MLAVKQDQTKQKPEANPFNITCGDYVLRLGERTHVMGILNRTPDSFSDGGRFRKDDVALAHVEKMIREGADIIDVGGESTRPGSLSVSAGEEIERVVPLIRKLTSRFDIPISVDTQKSEVALAALTAGACMVNDISALRADNRMADIVARHDVPVILMHMQGEPETMQVHPHYGNLIEEVAAFLSEAILTAKDSGIAEDKIVIDPGIGFGKTAAHNLSLIQNLQKFAVLNKPIAIGTSRKSFIGNVLGRTVDQRLMGTAASVALSIINGAHIVRVHDVKEMVDVARLVDAVRQQR